MNDFAFEPLPPIALALEEETLFSAAKSFESHDEWPQASAAMFELFESLLERKAVPEIRLKTFYDSDYAEARGRSPKQSFESNGTTGDDIYRHPHFLKYLCYFINGPALPKPAIDGLCRILNDDSGTSGMVMDQYKAHAREMVRRFRLDRLDAAREFFRLGLEIGMEVHQARTLRDAARTTN